MSGRKSKGFFRIKPVNGIDYLIKVKNERVKGKVKQKFLFHVGAVEDIINVVCKNEKQQMGK